MSTDQLFEDEVRAMLRRRAEDVPGDLPAPGPSQRVVALEPRRSGPLQPRWWLAAAAVAAVAGLLGLLVAASAGDRDSTDVGPASPADGAAPTSPDEPDPDRAGAPPGFDLATAPAFFLAEGSPSDVVAAYLGDRFGLSECRPGGSCMPGPLTFEVGPGPLDEPSAGAQWRYGSRLHGELVLRLTDAGWGVVLATTDGADLSDLTYQGGELGGTVRTGQYMALRVEVRSLGGELVATFEGSAGPETGSWLGFSSRITGPVVLRVQHLDEDDAPASLTELVLAPSD